MSGVWLFLFSVFAAGFSAGWLLSAHCFARRVARALDEARREEGGEGEE